MGSHERVIQTLDGEIPDQVPVIPQLGDHAGVIQGTSFDEMYKDPETAASVHLDAVDRYGYDVTTIQVEPSWPLVEALGGDIEYPPDKAPWVTDHPIEEREDIEDLEIPDLSTAPGTNVLIEGTRILSDRAEVPVAGFITGPFTFSMQIYPYEKFVSRLTQGDEDFVEALVDKSAEIVDSYSKALKDAGADLQVICEHDLQMFSPESMASYALPHLDSVTNFEHNILHMCGDVQNHVETHIDALVDTPRIDMVSVGPEVDLVSLKESYGDEIGFAGNIDHITFLPNASSEEVGERCTEVVTQAKPGGNYVLSPGCEITGDVPPENVEAMVAAAKQHGTYE